MEMSMKMKTWMMVLAAAAVMAAVSGCQDPVSGSNQTEADGKPKDGKPKDSPVAGVPAADDFTVSLAVGSGGPSAGGSPALSSRSVAGPDASGIQYGSIRNTIQVIVVKADTGKVTNFQQVVRQNDAQASAVFTLNGLLAGSKYHFLVLMGHRERDYAAETPGGDYVYKDDPPTLLAAGLLADREIREGAGDIVNITMKPLVVDTVFKQAGTVVEAALPAAKSGGALLSPMVGADLVWTLTRGFENLLAAQDIVAKEAGGIGIGFEWDVPYQDALPRSVKKTLLRIDGEADVEAAAALSGTDDNQIVLNLGDHAAGTAGSANFTIGYAPFGVSNMDAFTAIDPDALPWIIRNGVNDKAQNAGTVFPSPSAAAASPWTGTTADKPNGNGAVAFSFGFPASAVTELNLAPYGLMPVGGEDPKMSVSGSAQYAGTVAWTANGASHSGSFGPGTAYVATVTLNAASGWTFDGVAANAFSYAGASAVINSANSGVVTIVFPATGRYSGPFSGTTVGIMDSAIDLIRGAAGNDQLTLGLDQRTEELVSLLAATDLGAEGLVLNSSNSPRAVTIDGQGRTVRLAGGSGAVITVGSEVTLTLRNITFAGRTGNNAPLVRVQNGGKLVLETGAVIRDNVNAGGDGGGVTVIGNLTMSGNAAISGNKAQLYGGGVCVYTGASLVMTGSATISGNEAGEGGGGVTVAGNLTMSGNAAISGNTANMGGGGVYVLNGGTITMKGAAEVSGNTANNWSGGGIYLNDESTLDIKESAKIRDNTAARYGGGIRACSHKGNMIYSNYEINPGTAEKNYCPFP
jgi:hypothetical protein